MDSIQYNIDLQLEMGLFFEEKKDKDRDSLIDSF